MGGCPGNDTIAELVSHKLDLKSASSVEAHVADCASCRMLVATLASTSLPAVEPQNHAAEQGRYVVKQELARGGMGRISVALDTLLERTVAIKELLAPSTSLAARFRRELALTSRLQHPSIVSIHDAGTWPSGQPFYVMRLVSGEAFDRVIARHPDVASRLGLLPTAIAMVDALAYAHAQGVIHRDLKPANVLVGDFGETVVIDWGLAKDLRGDDEAEELVLGTPAYMAPEQARGEAVDERSDVYALGAVLYHVLAGAPPYKGESPDQIVLAVRAGAPPPLPRNVPADLLAIVDKAMARAPGDRYESASELAAELKRFERGQLVDAHRYTAPQLFARWVKKHRTAVIVGALAVVVLATVSVIGVRRILFEQARTEQRRADADELMRFMLTTLHDKLKPIGKLDLLGAVADKTQAYYASHAADQRPTDRFDRAGAMGNLAEVLAARGDAKQAIVELRAALEVANKLAAEFPDTFEYTHQVGSLEEKLAEQLVDLGDAAAALRESSVATAIDRKRAESLPDDPKAHDSLALVLLRQGHIEETLGTTDTALAHYREAMAIALAFQKRQPDARGWSQLLSESHEDIGNLLLKRGDTANALVENRAALDAALALQVREPANTDTMRDVLVYHLSVGSVLQANDPAGALVEYRAALAISEKLISHDATSSTWQRDYSITQHSIGAVLLARGDTKGALAAFQAARASLGRQLAMGPNDAVQREIFAADVHVGEVQFAEGDKAAALQTFEAARATAEKLATAHPDDVNTQRDLSAILGNIGAAMSATGDLKGAIAKYEASRAITAKLVAQDPANGDFQLDLAMGLVNLGSAYETLNDTAKAIATYRDVLERAKPFATKPQPSTDWLQTVYDCHSKIADILFETDKKAAAFEYRIALPIAKTLAERDPDSAEWKSAIAIVEKRI